MASRITFKAPKEYSATAFDLLVLSINQRLDETAAALKSADSTINRTLPVITGPVNNLVIGRGVWFELTVISADASLTGLVGGEGGRIIVIKNVAGSSNTLTLVNNSSASSEGNRFMTRSGSNATISVGAALVLLYSSEILGWVPIATVP